MLVLVVEKHMTCRSECIKSIKTMNTNNCISKIKVFPVKKQNTTNANLNVCNAFHRICAKKNDNSCFSTVLYRIVAKTIENKCFLFDLLEFDVKSVRTWFRLPQSSVL